MAEIKANNARITDLANEEGWKVGQNVAAGVVGLVIWPVWFGMDFQDRGREGRQIAVAAQRIPGYPSAAALQ
jgi:hypothetical protein